MKIRVIQGSELTSDLAGDWSRIQEENHSLVSPFFSPQFTQLVSQVRDDVYVGVLEDDNSIVGFFPYQQYHHGIARPVGGALSDYHGLISKEGEGINVRELLQACKLNIWQFDHLPADQTPFATYQWSNADSPYMDLSGGYELYCQERRQSGSKQIKKIGTLRRKLEREIGTLRVLIHEPNDNALRTMMKWKSQQYRESGTVDAFVYSWIVELMERIYATQDEEFAGVLSTLYVDDELIAVHLGMRSRTAWHYWFPAYHTDYAKFSPGLILLLDMADAAEQMGISMIDMGKDDSLYKQRLASGSTKLAQGAITRPSLPAMGMRLRHATERMFESMPLGKISSLPKRFFQRGDKKRRYL